MLLSQINTNNCKKSLFTNLPWPEDNKNTFQSSCHLSTTHSVGLKKIMGTRVLHVPQHVRKQLTFFLWRFCVKTPQNFFQANLTRFTSSWATWAFLILKMPACLKVLKKRLVQH